MWLVVTTHFLIVCSFKFINHLVKNKDKQTLHTSFNHFTKYIEPGIEMRALHLETLMIKLEARCMKSVHGG